MSVSWVVSLAFSYLFSFMLRVWIFNFFVLQLFHSQMIMSSPSSSYPHLPWFLPENDLSLNLAKKIGLEPGILAWKLHLPVSSSILPLTKDFKPFEEEKTTPLQPFRYIGSISLHSLLGGVFADMAFVYKNEQGKEMNRELKVQIEKL